MLATCNFTNIVMGMFKACHLGYAIDKEHEGQGLMQEVVAAGIDHPVPGAGPASHHGQLHAREPAKRRALERLGFEQEGTLGTI